MEFTLTFEELNILQKFLTNRVDYDLFHHALEYKYTDSYIEDIWKIYIKNPIAFITDRSEETFFDYIVNQIENTEYRG